MKGRRSAFLLGTGIFFFACSDPLGPRLSGAFVLASIDGAPAPFILANDHFSSGDSIRTELTADSITIIDEDDLQRAQNRRVTRYQLDGQIHVQEGGWSQTGKYILRDGRLIIDYGTIFGPSPLGAAETLTVRDARTLVGVRKVAGWCRTSTSECPTPVRDREFTYER